MRRILVDQARRRKRNKHGGDFRQITIPLEEVSVAKEDGLLEILDDALGRFEQVDAVACQLVKLRYFVGLSLADAAQALELPSRTADRIWAYAKAWLLREIQRELTDSW
ncbi:MAG TPA: ECF-type sigma factor, partial [Planctomycetaceae bacterium]|nr:ECF-type sigma factor [Planctomycetaceae bacterium]